MPELPEVETVVRDLQKRITGKKITAAWTDWPKLIKNPLKQSRRAADAGAVQDFLAGIRGCTVESVKRRGKNILIYLSGEMTMLVHLKMTGHFLIGKWETANHRALAVAPKEIVEDSYNHHVHLIMTLDSGEQLGLSDVRKFAKVLFGPRSIIEGLPELARLGSDALDPALTLRQLTAAIRVGRRPIKQVLMDPSVVAGIGNIYGDEILWRARVHPRRPAGGLTAAECCKIYQAMRSVLRTAVAMRGTSTSDFRDTFGKEGGYTGNRLVYRRTGEPCGRCRAPIERIVIAGRSAHYCSSCQGL